MFIKEIFPNKRGSSVLLTIKVSIAVHNTFVKYCVSVTKCTFSTLFSYLRR